MDVGFILALLKSGRLIFGIAAGAGAVTAGMTLLLFPPKKLKQIIYDEEHFVPEPPKQYVAIPLMPEGITFLAEPAPTLSTAWEGTPCPAPAFSCNADN